MSLATRMLPSDVTGVFEEEAKVCIANVKTAMAWTIASADVQGGLHALRQFSRFRDLRHPISLDDRVEFLHLLFEMMDIADFRLCGRTVLAINTLLKKRWPGLKERFSVDWRKLYTILQKCFFRAQRDEVLIGHERLTLHSGLCSLVQKSRWLFSENADSEILDELLPHFCPHDLTMFRAHALLCHFLPVHSPQKWIAKVFQYWVWIENFHDWDAHWFSLLGRLAKSEGGAYGDALGVDWNAYLPTLFARIHRVCELPMQSEKNPRVDKRGSVPDCALIPKNLWKGICRVIVYTLGDGSLTQELLTKLITYTKPFFHPSNHGEWDGSMNQLLSGLGDHFARRVRRDAERGLLTHDIKMKYVDTVLPLAMQAMFSKNHCVMSTAIRVLKHFSYIAPATVLPTLVERSFFALETLTQSHQTTSLIDSLTWVAHPLFSRQIFPEGATFLQPILQLALPGIDPNDKIKTIKTLQLFAAVLNVVPLIDCSSRPTTKLTPGPECALLLKSLANNSPDAPAEDVLEEWDATVAGSTSFFKDFVFELLGRLFVLFEHYDPKDKKGADYVGWIEHLCQLLFSQLHESLFEPVLDKLFALFSTQYIAGAVKLASRVLAGVAFANAPQALAKFLPFFYSRLVEVNKEGKPELVSSIGQARCDLILIAQLVKNVGDALLSHMPRLEVVLKLSLAHEDKSVYKAGHKLLRHTFVTLTRPRAANFRFVCQAVWDDPYFQQNPHKFWGARIHEEWMESDIGAKLLETAWDFPTQNGLAAASELVRTHWCDAKALLQRAIAESATPPADPKSAVTKAEIIKALQLTRTLLRGASRLLGSFPDPKEVDVALKLLSETAEITDGHCPIWWIGVRTNDDPHLALTPIRAEIGTLLHEVLPALQARESEDVAIIALYAKVVKVFCTERGISVDGVDSRIGAYRWTKNKVVNVCNGKKWLPRYLCIARASYMLQARFARPHHSTDPLKMSLLGNLAGLSIHAYSKIRTQAQRGLHSALFLLHPSAALPFLPQFVSVLSDKEAIPEAATGAVYSLIDSTMMGAIHNDYASFVDFIISQCKSFHHEKFSVQMRLTELFTTFASQFPGPRPITLELPPATVSPLVERCLAGLSVTEIRKAATTKSTSESEVRWQLHQRLTSTLEAVLIEPSLHWKYQVLVSVLFRLTMLPSKPASSPSDPLPPPHPLPAGVLKWLVTAMVDDVVALRTVAIRIMKYILYLNKKKRPRVKAEFKDLDFDKSVSPEEWNSFPFQDKIWIGWVPGQTYSGIAYQAWPSAEAHAPSPDVMCILEFFKQPGVFGKFLDCLATDHRLDRTEGTANLSSMFQNLASDSLRGLYMDRKYYTRTTAGRMSVAFNIHNAVLFKGLFQVFQVDFLDIVKADLERMCNNSTEREHQVAAAEVLAGLLRGSKHWTHAQLEQLWAFLLPLLKKTIGNMVAESVKDWMDALRFGLANLDPRRSPALADLLFTHMLAPDTAVVQTTRLKLCEAGLIEGTWRTETVIKRVLRELDGNLAQPFQTVREEVGRILYTVARNLWLGGEKEHKLHPDFDSFLSKWESELTTLQLAASEINPEDTQHPAVLAYKNGRQTLFFFLAATSIGEMPVHMPIFPRFLPWVLSSHDDPDKELVALAHHYAGVIGAAVVNAQQPHTVIDTLDKTLLSPSWHVRLSTLPLFLCIGHTAVYSREKLSALVNKLVPLLYDLHLDIRERACKQIAGLLRCLDTEDFEKLRSDLCKSQRRRKKVAAGDNVATAKHHGEVLAVCMFVLGFPLEVPPWMPDLLMLVATHTSDPSPMNHSAKFTLSEFKRTHQDMWEQFKELFTPDQLEVLSDTLASPSYYA